MAGDAPRRRGLAAIAHDLQNPLAVIGFSAARLIQERAPDDEGIRRAAEAILRSVHRAERLVQDLRDMEAGGLYEFDAYPFDVRPAWVPAASLLAEAATAGEPLAGQHALTVEEIADLPLVWADAPRVGQVFGNLVGNAVKFSPPGGRITVSARSEDGEVHFLVTDLGPGIKAEDRRRVFAPFWQVDPRDRGGRGLGLWICRQIVEAHGGRIWIEGPADGGALFRFALPSAAAQADRPGPHVVSTQLGSDARPPHVVADARAAS
jgi:signal transduction histidine kinase